jgi:hypothetical protein
VTGLSFRRGVFLPHFRCLTLAGAALCLALPARAQTQDGLHTEIGYGVSYFGGDYGQPGQDTTVLYAPMTATLRAPNWRLEASVPFIQIRGPNNVAGADGTPVVVGEGSGSPTTRQGLGDVLVGGGVYLPRAPHLPLFDLSAKMKAPTASTDLGTGRADYTAQLAAYQPLTPKLLLMASAGYQWLGSSDLYHLRSGPTGMVGFNYKPSATLDTGATVNFTSRIADGIDHQVFVSPYATWRAAKIWGLTAYALAGLTRSSPSIGGGLQITFYR